LEPRSVVIGIYLALEKAGAKNLVERTRLAARAAGAKFTNGQAATWLAPFVSEHHKNTPESTRRGFANLTHGRDCGQETDGIADGIADGILSTERTGLRTGTRTENGRDDGLTRDKGISSLDLSSAETDDSLRSSSALPAAPAKKQSRPLRLPLDAEVQVAKHAMLDAVWELLEPTLGRSIGKTAWKKQNANVATDLVSLGRPLGDILAAWHSATGRLGSPCRTMRVLRDELGRMDAGGGSGDCGCGLGSRDCERLHSEHNTTTDRLPTIPELEAACNQ
jgi:hypothetical protein